MSNKTYLSTTQQEDQYIDATSPEILSYYGIMAVIIAFLLWLVWTINDEGE